jgi:hypothetical protein
MSFLKTLGQFFFGKDPDIFDEKGKVRHQFPRTKWQAWQNRFKDNPDYDWHRHTGKLGLQKISPSAPKPTAPATATDKNR